MIQERIPRYVVSRNEQSDATMAYCPYCRWIGVYRTMEEAQTAGITHARDCETA